VARHVSQWCAAIGVLFVLVVWGCSGDGPSFTGPGARAVTYANACLGGSGCPTGQIPPSLRRRLRLPGVSGSACPLTVPVHRISQSYGNAVGSGPVYPIVTGATAEVTFVYPPPPNSAYPKGFGGSKVLWVIAADYSGPVLIRGRQLDGARPLWFQLGGDRPALPEMQLPPATAPGWRDWPSATLLTKAGCYAWQIDGTSFSTVIVFQAAVQAKK
jgi:hypothetical protein